MPSFRPARVPVVALLPAVLTALLGVLLVVPAAHAASGSRTVSGGRLDWGIKASFQSYVTGPIAQGSWSLTGSAGTVGSDQFRFPSAQGSYDPASGALSAGFQGGVHFVGHRKSDGGYQLDLAISHPSVRISGRSGTLYADMTSKAKDTGKVTTSSQVPMASLALGGVSTRGVTGPRIALTNVPATLTAQGARAFAGYYTAGTPLDPVSLSVDLHTPATKAPTPGSTGPATTPTAKSTAKSSAGKAGSGTVLDAAVDWGVRRTFREYVTGDIAKGRWTVSHGAKDGGALFRFGAGHGRYEPAGHTLDASFAGSLRFLGLRAADGTYGLDLTIDDVRVQVAGGKGTLYADGSPFVTFAVPAGLTPHGGLLSLAGLPTKLTAQGAKKFNGLYTAGTSMDPLTVSVVLDKSAALPALPDIGSDPASTAPQPGTSSPAASPKAQLAARTQESADSGDGAPVGALTGGAAAVLAAAAATTYVLRRRRRNPAD